MDDADLLAFEKEIEQLAAAAPAENSIGGTDTKKGKKTTSTSSSSSSGVNAEKSSLASKASTSKKRPIVTYEAQPAKKKPKKEVQVESKPLKEPVRVPTKTAAKSQENAAQLSTLTTQQQTPPRSVSPPRSDGRLRIGGKTTSSSSSSLSNSAGVLPISGGRGGPLGSRMLSSSSAQAIGQQKQKHPYMTQNAIPANYGGVLYNAQGLPEPEKKKNKKRKKPQKVASSANPMSVRTIAGKVWEDKTLMEWPKNDFRLFCGDLGNEVTDDMLGKAFKQYASCAKARVIRDKRTGKSRGYGFVSFLEATDFIKAFREMDGKYIGNRPVKLRKSKWKDRMLKK